jgi:transcriptional regulator with XRE-family HTH domain
VKEVAVEEHPAPVSLQVDADKLVGIDEKAEKMRIVYDEVDLPIEDIIIPEKRQREFHPEIVEVLRESIYREGLKHRIGVSRHPDGTPWLTSGFHRLKALDGNGVKMIPCRVKTVFGADGQISQDPSDLLWDTLDELEENLCRGGMSVAETCSALFLREATLKDLGLRAESGKGNHGKGERSRTLTTEELAKKLGISERVYQEYTQIGRNIDPSVMEKIVKSPGKLKDNKSEMKKIARIKEPEKQDEVVDNIESGRAKNVEAAVNPSTPSTVDVKNNDQAAMLNTDTASKTNEQVLADAKARKEAYEKAEADKKETEKEADEEEPHLVCKIDTGHVPAREFIDLIESYLHSSAFVWSANMSSVLDDGTSDDNATYFVVPDGYGSRFEFTKALRSQMKPKWIIDVGWLNFDASP